VLDVHFGSGAQRTYVEFRDGSYCWEVTLEKRKEIRIKRDVKGIDFGVTDWFQLPQNRIQRMSSH